MTKLPRDAKAFAQRVKMGSARLWLLVEGKAHDRPFYERLLDSSMRCSAEGFGIRLVEELEVDGTSSGGKEALHKVFDLYEAEGLLSLQSHGGAKLIAFAFDRDFDDLSNSVRDHYHAFYTTGMDVEAEIVLNGDVLAATSSAYSVTRSSISAVVPPGQTLASSLANRWREWITAGVVAECSGVSIDVRYSHRSRINENGFGPTKPDAAMELRSKLEARLSHADAKAAFDTIRARVDELFDAGQEWRLVKGKWLASFVHHLVAEGLSEEPREKNVTADTVIKTCLETVDFSGPWAEPYRHRLEALLVA